ncbi:MAG: HAD family phosphatase [Clostridia bacterium]|nr:HAD family phosphatase [Clostridia bacterium]
MSGLFCAEEAAARRIRMVVTDLDGTLLKDDKTISPFTKAAIAGLRARGVRFALATARPIRSVRGFLPDLGFDGAVYHNGAVVEAEGERLSGFGIERPLDVVRSILEREPGARVAVEANDVLFGNFDTQTVWPGVSCVRTADFHEIAPLTADKIIVGAETPAEAAALEERLPPALYAQISENVIAMIMNCRATKLNGIRMLAARWGVGLSEIAAFGDDYNDVEMLGACGVGVAVANALDEAKAAADEVCLSNEADGVARWIEENIPSPNRICYTGFSG